MRDDRLFADLVQHHDRSLRASAVGPPPGPALATGRDVGVGTALRDLAVPDHGPAFWHDLGADLLRSGRDDDDAADAVDASAPSSPAEAAPSTPATAAHPA